MIPGIQDDMEGCPDPDLNTLYMTLSALLGLFMFMIYQTIKTVVKSSNKKKIMSKKNKLKDDEYRDLVLELYGEDALKNSMSGSTNHSSRKDKDTSHSGSHHSARKHTIETPAIKKIGQDDFEEVNV